MLTDCCAFDIDLSLSNLDRLSIELGICKKLSSTSRVIENSEEHLVVILPNSRSPAYYLLKLRHGIYDVDYRYVFTCLDIDACCKQFRRGNDHRCCHFDVHKPVKESPTDISFFGRDSHNIIWIFTNKICICVIQGTSHHISVLLIYTKDNSLLKSIV